MEDNKLNNYLDEIGREQLLTEAEERELSAKALTGDKRAQDRLVERNLRFVVAIATQYQGKGLAIDDLISEGNLGLMKAAKKFDASRGKRFASYAAIFVRQSIEKALQRENGGKGETTDDGQRVVRAAGRPPRSIDAPLGSKTGVSLLSVLVDAGAPATDKRVYDANIERAFEIALGSLEERERQVVEACYGLGSEAMTMAETAEAMGLKRERVRQIRDRALRRMKKAYKRKLAELRQ